MATCSGAADEVNKRINQAFVTQTYPREGIIVVRGKVLGIDTNIVIDDYLPFDNNNLYFAKST